MLSSSYLQKSRNGVYFARFVIPAQQRVPADGRDFKLSTGTKDPRHAKSIVRYLRVLFDSFLMENATVQRASAIAFLQARMKKPTVPPMPYGVRIKGQGFDIELTDLGPQDVGNIDELIENATRGATRASSSAIALWERPSDVLSEALPAHAPAINEPGRLSPVAAKTVGRLVKEYLKYEEDRATEKEIGVKKVPQIRTRLKPFIDRFSARHVGTLTPLDLEQYRKDLAYYPKNIDKLPGAGGLPFDTLTQRVRSKSLFRVDGQQAQTITQNTLDGYLTVAANFLEFCKRQYAVNPTLLEGFKVKTTQARKGASRRAFTQKEMQQIFGSDYYRDGAYNRSYQYWVIHLAAFTGARVNELSQLTTEDVRQDDEGLWFLNITAAEDDGQSVKNEESRRIIPVHQKLIDLGFIDYCEANKAAAKDGPSNLFDLKRAKADGYGKAASQWFNTKYLRDYLKIDDPNVVFHSFRHRFISSLAQAILDASGVSEETAIKERIPEALILRRLAGHSVAHAMTAGRGQFDVHTDTYTGAFSVRSMKRVIDRLDYPGLNFFAYKAASSGRRKRMRTADEDAHGPISLDFLFS
jgi:integrase